MIKCNTCGAAIDRRDAFCAKCGELTERGQPMAQKIGSVVGAISTESGKLVRWIMEYVRDEAHRKQVIAGGATIALLLVVMTDNPITAGASSLFAGEENSPQLTDDGLPDFASYEDVFIGDEEEFIVMGTANIRDFPTSQGTSVLGSLTEGETVMAREVQAFDPGSRWLKLATGGYVWGENFVSVNQSETDEDGAAADSNSFAANIRGRWSTMASCAGHEPDTILEIAGRTINLGNSFGDLQRVTKDELGRSEYHIGFFGNDHEWSAVWRISPNANGFTLFIDDVEYPDSPMQEFHSVSAGCRPEFMID